jgi:hypothetical protein
MTNTSPPPPSESQRPPIPTKEQLNSMSKPDLVDLLHAALTAQSLATQNMASMGRLLEDTAKKNKALESANETLQAEVTTLRNQPR